MGSRGRLFQQKVEIRVIWGSLGCPLGRPWVGFRVESFEAKKMMKKKSGSCLPRRDTRTPVKRDFREEFLGMGPARLRSSFGWAGGLFTLRASRRGHMRLRGSAVGRTRGYLGKNGYKSKKTNQTVIEFWIQQVSVNAPKDDSSCGDDGNSATSMQTDLQQRGSADGDDQVDCGVHGPVHFLRLI